jgi:two-component system, OmpR family, alkaline phosphatase synthesis response regulator PhoP
MVVVWTKCGHGVNALTHLFDKSGMAQGRTILVCDDEVAIRSIVVAKLRSAGYTVCEGRNGLEGYSWVDHRALPPGTPHKSPVPIVPDLVVTDLQMPMMSGLEMATRLREYGPTAHVPVLMLTARGYIVSDAEREQTNIRQFMQKPFGAAQLLERVKALLEESQALGERKAAA